MYQTGSECGKCGGPLFLEHGSQGTQHPRYACPCSPPGPLSSVLTPRFSMLRFLNATDYGITTQS